MSSVDDGCPWIEWEEVGIERVNDEVLDTGE